MATKGATEGLTLPDGTVLPEREIELTFILGSGPGGQNVNKVATAAQLRFDAMRSPGLTDATRARLRRLAGSRMTQDGVIVITARRFRTQQRNREDALARLAELLAQALQRPVIRRPTRPSRAARARRMDEKSQRGALKRGRRPDRSAD